MKPPITLATLAQATAQEVFDQVAEHLLTQGKQARKARAGYTSMMFCSYRGDDGCKCAAGCLIGDDEYKPGFEGVGWYGLVENFGVAANHDDLIVSLQSIHDSRPPDKWYDCLHTLAQRFELSIKVLEKFKKDEA